jgi:hypothetical protein
MRLDFNWPGRCGMMLVRFVADNMYLDALTDPVKN